MAVVLTHRNYFKVAEANLELIRADLWDIEFLHFPKAVYDPGIELIKRRLNKVSFGNFSDPEAITKEVLGHTTTSHAGRKSSPQSVTLSFVDREDQALTFMIQDWKDQTAESDYGFGRHKSEMIIDQFNIIYYNTLLQPYQRIEFYHGLYEASDLPKEAEDHGGDNSDVSITIKFAHSKPFTL